MERKTGREGKQEIGEKWKKEDITGKKRRGRGKNKNKKTHDEDGSRK